MNENQEEYEEIPDSEYSSSATMNSITFNNLCRELSEVGNDTKIELNKDFIKFNVMENNITKAEMKYEANNTTNINEQLFINSETSVKMTFPLLYLYIISKCSSIGKQVTLSLNEEYPLKIEYKLDEFSKLKFYLAPRIDEDKPDKRN